MKKLFYFLFFCHVSVSAQTFIEKEEMPLSPDSAQIMLEWQFYTFEEQFREYASRAHPADTLGPCAEYCLRWRKDVHNNIPWISRGGETTACSVKIPISSFSTAGNGRTVGLPVGDRYYLVVCSYPSGLMNVSVDYYVRETSPATK